MPAYHHRLPRAHRRFKTCATEHVVKPPCCELIVPRAGTPRIVVADLADAAAAVFELLDWPICGGALIMLDAQRALLGVVIDPPPELAEVLTWLAHLPMPVAAGLGRCCQVILVVAEEDIRDEPVSERTEYFFHAAQQIALNHGLLLMDVVFANPHRLQSLAAVCDPHCVWFDDLDLGDAG